MKSKIVGRLGRIMVGQQTSDADRSSLQEISLDAEGNTFELRQKSCPTCNISDQRVLGYRGGRWHRYGLGLATRIVQCKQCRLIFPNPFPYPRNPQTLYGDPAKYFESHDAHTSECSRTTGCRKLIRQIAQLAKKTPLSILDVGSGRGELLKAARLEGMCDVVGLEFAQAMIDYVQSRYGITLVPQTIEQYAASTTRTFDAIVLNAVLEHVCDPDSMIRACAKLARPGSVLYIDVPNEPNLLTVVGNTLNRIRGHRAVFNLSPTWIPYHVFGFNPHALRILLKKYGFEIMHIRTFATPAVPSRPDLGDRLKAFIGTQLNRLANVTGTASNMYVWARRI